MTFFEILLHELKLIWYKKLGGSFSQLEYWKKSQFEKCSAGLRRIAEKLVPKEDMLEKIQNQFLTLSLSDNMGV